MITPGGCDLEGMNRYSCRGDAMSLRVEFVDFLLRIKQGVPGMMLAMLVIFTVFLPLVELCNPLQPVVATRIRTLIFLPLPLASSTFLVYSCTSLSSHVPPQRCPLSTAHISPSFPMPHFYVLGASTWQQEH